MIEKQVLSLLERFVVAHEQVAYELFEIRRLAENEQVKNEERWEPTSYQQEVEDEQ